LACAALLGQGKLVMIVYDVGGNDFQESENGIGKAWLEASQEAAVVLAQFEIGLLNQVVQNVAGGFTESPGSPRHHPGDDGLKSPDEFFPCRRILRPGTHLNQVVCGKRRIGNQIVYPRLGKRLLPEEGVFYDIAAKILQQIEICHEFGNQASSWAASLA
jgi:hypothetical protein